MSANLRAALTVTFEDRASNGLDRLKDGLTAIGRIGRNMQLDGIRDADRNLRHAADGAGLLSRALGTIGSAADRATAAIHRTGQAVKAWGKGAVGSQSPMGAFAAAAGGYSLSTQLDAWGKQSGLLRSGSIASGQYGADGDQFMKTWGKYYNEMALKSGQRSTDLADVGFWMQFNGISTDQIQTTLPGMARMATTYSAPVKDVARVAESMMFVAKLKPEEIERGLAVMTMLGKEGGFQFADQAALFPKVMGAAGMRGMTGMGAVDELNAAMQILLKANSDREPGEAATQLRDFLLKLDTEDTRKNFKENGVDIRAHLADGMLKGRSPLEVGLDAILQVQNRVAAQKKIKDPTLRAQSDGQVISDLFGDLQAQFGAGALLANLAEYLRLKKLAKEVDVARTDRDFGERARDDGFALEGLKERIEQGGRRIGKEFTPAVRVANGVLDQLAEKVERLDEKYPGLIGKVVLATGGMIALAAALAVVGMGASAVGAGIAVLASPLGVALGLLAGGAYYVMSNWETFGPAFTKVWEGTKRTAIGFATWVNSTLKLDHIAARNALIEVWEGGKTLFEGAFEVWKKIFGDAFKLLDDWTGGAITDTFKRIADAIGGAVDKIKAFIAALQSIPDGMFSGDGASRATPNVPPEYAPPGSVPGLPGSNGILELPLHRMSDPLGSGMGGTTTVYIRAEPGTVVTRTEGDQRGLQLNPGPTTVRV